MHNEGFGKKWIEKILGKVDKDQGVANAGKVLGIGDDGQVVPVEQSGGGTSLPFTAMTTFNGLPNLTMVEASLNIGTSATVTAYDSATNTVTIAQSRETLTKFTLLPTRKTTQHFEYAYRETPISLQTGYEGKNVVIIGRMYNRFTIRSDGSKIDERSTLYIDSCTVDGNTANVTVNQTGSYFADITKLVNIYLN